MCIRDRNKRKVAISGRSMLNIIGVANDLGYMNIPENVLIDIDEINKYPRHKITLITTGSQGETMSALTRIAFSDHRKVEITPGDLVIISANPIPGNEKLVSRVIDELFKKLSLIHILISICAVSTNISLTNLFF